MELLPTALTFDDVLILPNYSEVLPTEVDTTTTLAPGLSLKIPLMSAAMDTVTELEMALKLAELGAMGILHKSCEIQQQVEWLKQVRAQVPNGYVGAATGVGAVGLERGLALIDAGATVLVVDTAHGHSKAVLDQVRAFRKARPSTYIIGGNVGTSDGAKAMIEAGASAVKVGIGPGAICTTRVVSGIGAPQLQAIIDCAAVCGPAKISLIADGGIKTSGDITKAIAAGATAVMMGSMFAGTDEAPGEIIQSGSGQLKLYRGMGSLSAMKKGSKDRYGQGGVIDSTKLVPEGVEGFVAYKGPVEGVLNQMVGGLRSGMGYVGAKTILELQKKSRFVQVSMASLQESHPHSLSAIRSAPNYSVKGGQ